MSVHVKVCCDFHYRNKITFFFFFFCINVNETSPKRNPRLNNEYTFFSTLNSTGTEFAQDIICLSCRRRWRVISQSDQAKFHWPLNPNSSSVNSCLVMQMLELYYVSWHDFLFIFTKLLSLSDISTVRNGCVQQVEAQNPLNKQERHGETEGEISTASRGVALHLVTSRATNKPYLHHHTSGTLQTQKTLMLLFPPC